MKAGSAGKGDRDPSERSAGYSTASQGLGRCLTLGLRRLNLLSGQGRNAKRSP